MLLKKAEPVRGRLDAVITEARRRSEQREREYRAQALKLFPWVCARCGREFSGKRLRELTVHHKDHNHDYNPPDGSKWELLCIYCHDNEHARFLEQEWHDGGEPDPEPSSSMAHRPFAGLEELLKKQRE